MSPRRTMRAARAMTLMMVGRRRIRIGSRGTFRQATRTVAHHSAGGRMVVDGSPRTDDIHRDKSVAGSNRGMEREPSMGWQP
ncbi:MAG: hypothetical protein H6637_08640 [Ardenticatenales bacterium]|nr:hypothetical protein [Ardenticatenales bacterium]